MALDSSTSRSRRAILAAAAGAAAAFATRAIADPSEARAAGDDASVIHIGDTYANAQSQTTVGNQANDNVVLWVASNSGSGHGGGTALVGYSDHAVGVSGGSGSFPALSMSIGVSGVSSSGTGVNGASTSGIGVRGTSNSNIGIKGTGSFRGVLGESSNDVGVQGLGHNYGVTGMGTGDSSVGVAGSGPYLGVYGNSPGRAVLGLCTSAAGWAGYFQGRVFTDRYIEMAEVSNPPAPGSNKARLFIRDNGSGKTQLCVRFHNGTIRVLAAA